MEKQYKCCNKPHLHKGRIWGIAFLPVDVCCNCEEAEAKFGWFGEVLLFIGGLFNDQDQFAIQMLDKEDKGLKLNG